jgi:predicted Zn-dependent protease
MKPQPPAPDAAELYAQAEAAMGRGRPAEARERLERLLARHPRHRLAEPARYELAQMALEAGHPGAAASQLDALLATALDPALEEPARHLRCRVERVAGRPREAAECLRRFRRDFPGSTRDLEALRALLELMSPAERCAEGREELRELVRLAAAGRHAPRARAWTEECGR